LKVAWKPGGEAGLAHLRLRLGTIIATQHHLAVHVAV